MSSNTVENHYSYGDKGAGNAPPPNAPDMNRGDDYFFDEDHDPVPGDTEGTSTQEPPPPRVNRLKKLAGKLVAPYKILRVAILYEPSKGWTEYSNGLFGCQNNSKLSCCCGSACPCCVHGVNASDVVTGREGKWEKSATGKRVGLYFVLQQALVCCICPVCAGAAVRDKIWESATEAGGQTEIKAVREKISMCKDCQIFCAPYLCCPCLAVLQDKRALAKSLPILEAKRRKLNAPAFAMKEFTLPDDVIANAEEGNPDGGDRTTEKTDDII